MQANNRFLEHQKREVAQKYRKNQLRLAKGASFFAKVFDIWMLKRTISEELEALMSIYNQTE